MFFLNLFDAPKQFARSAQLIFGNEPRQLDFALCDVAVPASANGVRVVVGHRLVLLAGVEMEDALRVTLQRTMECSAN